MNTNNGICDIVDKLANTEAILSEMSNCIEQGIDVGQLVKLAFHFGMKDKKSLIELLTDFNRSPSFNEKEKSLTTELIRRMASVKLVNIDGKKYTMHTCVLPVVVGSHYGSYIESMVMPPLIRVNLELRLKNYLLTKGVVGDVSVTGSLFPFEKYAPSIDEYVDYSGYLSSICADEVYINSGVNELLLLPFTVMTENKAGDALFGVNSGLYSAFNEKYIKDFLPEVKQVLGFLFKASKYNLSIGLPMLGNEGLWGTLSLIRMENCLRDISKQAVIASPSEYKVIIVNDSSCDSIRINFYIGNENFYSFDYGHYVSFNLSNECRDVQIVKDFLEEHGFKCSTVNGKIKGTLDEENERGILSLCVC